jgi:hypothetical protein
MICNCPYPDCNIPIEIIEINCAIFRCGIYKDYDNYGKQINPHLSKEDCDILKQSDKIWGCGRPFKLIKKNDEKQVELQLQTQDEKYILIPCDYI